MAFATRWPLAPGFRRLPEVKERAMRLVAWRQAVRSLAWWILLEARPVQFSPRRWRFAADSSGRVVAEEVLASAMPACVD